MNNEQSMSGNVSLNSNSLDLLILDIMKSAQDINVTLDEIIRVVAETSEYLESENATKYRKKFEKQIPSFKNIVRNVENYAYSLKNVETTFEEKSVELRQKVLNDAEKFKIN